MACTKCGALLEHLRIAGRLVTRCTNQRCPRSAVVVQPRMSLAEIEPHGDLTSDMRHASIRQGFALLRAGTL